MFENIELIANWSVSSGDGPRIAIYDRISKQDVCHLSGDKCRERAAFIVRACNSHAELLEVLKNLAWEVNAGGKMIQLALMNAQEAIAKAEGRAE